MHHGQSNPSASPSVAVVIPCHNHGAFLLDALRSVEAQTHRPAECVVVDDGSADPETIRVIDGLKGSAVRVIRQANQGLSAARNVGIRATRTEFFVPLDADDRLHPRLIERLLPPMLADPKLGYSYCHVRFFGAQQGVWRCPAYEPRRLLAYNLCNPAAVVRRDAFDQVGGYQSDMIYGFEDWDFWIALLGAGYHGQCVPEPLFCYRKHPGGSMLTRAMPRRQEMLDQIIAHHRDTFARFLGVPASDQELHEAQAALVRLYAIQDSRFWRALGWLAGPKDASNEDPRRCLARIEASRPYRLVQAFKSTHAYRWYAGRKYG